MKLTYTAVALAATVGLPLLTNAAPTLQRRDGITCTKKYEGDLYISNETTDGAGTPVTYTTAPDGNYVLTNDQAAVTAGGSTRFQFDECTTDGWNAPPKEFGQIKPVPLADQVQCVTANSIQYSVPGLEGRSLEVRDCGAENAGITEQQWFYANYHTENNGQDAVTLQLTGNPNGGDASYDLGAIYVGNTTDNDASVIAVKYAGAHILTLNLKNVQVVS